VRDIKLGSRVIIRHVRKCPCVMPMRLEEEGSVGTVTDSKYSTADMVFVRLDKYHYQAYPGVHFFKTCVHPLKSLGDVRKIYNGNC
jgi:hypothetical protein